MLAATEKVWRLADGSGGGLGGDYVLSGYVRVVLLFYEARFGPAIRVVGLFYNFMFAWPYLV